ncbi:MAG: AgmX/PglI C-terminal domain-containing protein, partial [Myxococcales bacterium]|nr:AgmX/PglI C-terminal domain-containing protein [Myxococcales bacterium]
AVGRPSGPAEVPTSGASSAVATPTTSARNEQQGRLPVDVIKTVIASHYRYLRECFEEGLARQPGLAGLVNVHFTIGLEGDVTVSSTEGSTIGDPAVVGCVRERFTSVQFPKPEGGVVTVTYPIAFAPGPAASPSAAPSAPAR